MRQSVGLLDMDEDEDVKLSTHAVQLCVLLCIFIIITMVLLLNMLIAAMSDTYAKVSEVKDQMYIRLLAESTLTVERKLPLWLRPKQAEPFRRKDERL